jgi:hypothetical protein
MAHYEPVTVDPQDIHRAQAMWHNFTQWLKWGGGIVAAIVALMALVFVDW